MRQVEQSGDVVATAVARNITMRRHSMLLALCMARESSRAAAVNIAVRLVNEERESEVVKGGKGIRVSAYCAQRRRRNE